MASRTLSPAFTKTFFVGCCWRRHFFEPGADIWLTHVNAPKSHMQQRFHMFILGSTGFWHLGLKMRRRQFRART